MPRDGCFRVVGASNSSGSVQRKAVTVSCSASDRALSRLFQPCCRSIGMLQTWEQSWHKTDFSDISDDISKSAYKITSETCLERLLGPDYPRSRCQNPRCTRLSDSFSPGGVGEFFFLTDISRPRSQIAMIHGALAASLSALSNACRIVRIG